MKEQVVINATYLAKTISTKKLLSGGRSSTILKRFPVLEGIRGLYALDEHGTPTVFMLMGTPTDYYQMMTKSKTMPLLIGEVI